MRNRLLMATTILTLIAAVSAMAQSQLPGPEQRLTITQALNLATQFQAGAFESGGTRHLPYRYFDPSGRVPAGGKYPVILYLHGEAAAGTDNEAQLTSTATATVWMEPHHLAQNPSYVLAPQIPRGTDWTQEGAYADTLGLLQQFIRNHPDADSNRVYIVGFSMGGSGAWNMLLKNPQLFASALVISGSAEPWLDDYDAWARLRHTPVIVVHAYDDALVPVSHAMNAISALQAAGNTFVGTGGPTPALWTPSSTPSPHDAWYTAFDKFEVIYNSLFLGDLGRSRNGELDPTTLFTHRQLGNGISEVWDWALGTSIVIERADKAAIFDTTMGRIGENGGIYHYIRDNVLANKDIDLDVYITHDHGDHIRGLASFIGADQLKHVYVHEPDDRAVESILGADAGKIVRVRDGDRIPFGGSQFEIINVPGHTLGSIVIKFEDYLFSGDTIGTGYVGVSRISIEDYANSLRHLLEKMGDGHYQILGGHTGELSAPLTERYVTDLLAVATGIVDGTIAGAPYWRSRDLATRKVSTVGRSSITYYLRNIHRIDAALYSLQISDGDLRRGHRWGDEGFWSHISYYHAEVGETVAGLDITPIVFENDYRRLAINGKNAVSGKPHRVSLDPGTNRFDIVVTAADGASRTYTLDVERARPR